MRGKVGSKGATSIRSGYDRWASVYDHDANPMPALEAPLVREQVGDVRGMSALDLGCGTGRHALWLSASGAAVTAVDFSAEMLVQAQSKVGAETIHFIEHDLHDRLPLSDQAFQLVVSGLVLEHIVDLGAFFGEVRRVLCPGGQAVLSTMHPAMFLRGSQARFTDPDSGEIIQPGSYAHQTSDFIRAALGAGLRLTHLGEHSPDASFASSYPRCEKYVGWPMVLLLSFTA